MPQRIIDAFYCAERSVLIALSDEIPLLPVNKRDEQSARIALTNPFRPFGGTEEAQAVAGRGLKQAVSDGLPVKFF